MTKLSTKDIHGVQIRSWIYQWQSFSYEAMQSTGFTQAIGPALEKIYDGDKELIAEKLDKYLAFYNTENNMSQIIMGACLAIEETGSENATDTSLAIRTGLMGPFAGLGDSLFKISCKVIVGSLVGYMALQGSLVGLFIDILVEMVGFNIIKYNFFKLGYSQGTSFITKNQDRIKALMNAAVVLGLTVVGCMIPSTVKIATKLVYTNGDAVQAIQTDILDKIFPYLLPVCVTALVYWGLGLKKMTTVRMVWLIIAAAILLTVAGIL
ncbi:MAG: PTS system mannose/fructose/sorbose family transporter subunit IID [Erysipelotrichaceae bacterium]|jgi:PTS system mannose-specific IID component|nr:PTS system mannose/fructose/sorbose family transporter subunit IID [Erysipelotrichaceae bacterium]